MVRKKDRNLVLVFTALILLTTVVIVLLIGKQTLLDFEGEAEFQSSQVEKDVAAIINFVHHVSYVAQDHFDEVGQDADELYDELVYNSSNDTYFLNIDENGGNTEGVSFISGSGQVPVSEEMISELNFAFELNKYFESIYSTSENVCSVYYVSENDFICIYPYESQKGLSYTDEIQDREWYENATPEENPDRVPTWSSIYVDALGRGLVSTLSMPIYYGDEFKGVVGVDCTVKGFEEILATDKPYETYMIDSEGDIVASNTYLTENPEEVINVGELSDDELRKIFETANLGSKEIELIDGNFVYAISIDGTDWMYVSVLSTSNLILESILKATPIIFLILVLLFIFIYSKKHHEKNKLEAQNELLGKKVHERTRELKRTQEETNDAISTLNEFREAVSTLIEYRDNETRNHIFRTKYFAKVLTETLATREKYQDMITPEYVSKIYNAVTSHDIGNVGVKEEILLKPSKLTNEEFAEMQQHTIIGYETLLKTKEKLGSNSFIDCALELTRHHHERWDGSGYPDKLAGEDIPLSARIMAVVDVYDALTSKRVYKLAMTHAEAVEIIISDSGTHFDPEVVEAFKACEHTFKKIAEENADE